MARRGWRSILAVAAFAVGVAGCDTGAFLAPEDSLPVHPAEAVIRPGESVTLVPGDQGPNEQATGESVSFVSSDTSVATVSADGVVRGRSAGKATIVVKTSKGKGQSKIKVEEPTESTGASLAEIRANVDHRTFTAAGQTAQLSAQAYDASGDPVGDVKFSWSTSDASIANVDAMGLVVARAVGSAFVVVSALGFVSDTVAITVQDGPAGTPNGDSHEPEGLTPYSDHDFSVIEADGWIGNSSAQEVVQDPTAPRSPGSVGSLLFAEGMGSRAPASHRLGGWSSRELYFEFWFKVSANWQGHDSGVNKIFYITDNSSGNTGDPLMLILGGSNNGSLHWRIARQNPDFAAIPHYTHDSPYNEVRPTSASAEQVRGQWHRIEVYIVSNTPGQTDGQLHVWNNGVKIIQRTSVQFLSPDSDGELDNLRWEPIWGGQNDTVEQDMYQYMDHIYVSGR